MEDIEISLNDLSNLIAEIEKAKGDLKLSSKLQKELISSAKTWLQESPSIRSIEISKRRRVVLSARRICFKAWNIANERFQESERATCKSRILFTNPFNFI